jgi:hypothetical protein
VTGGEKYMLTFREIEKVVNEFMDRFYEKEHGSHTEKSSEVIRDEFLRMIQSEPEPEGISS